MFAEQIDLASLECINMAYFDDSVGISSAFSLPKHYAIAAGGNWVALNGCWQDGELSNSFQPLAADSIIKIIKKEGGGEVKERGEKCNCNSSVVGTHTGTLFQLACLLSLKEKKQGHTVLRVITLAKLA